MGEAWLPRLTLLDAFELRADGEGVALPQSAQRLLALLALRARSMHRTCVAGVLWPDVAEDRARGNLRSALWRLQRSAGGIVRATGHDLQITPEVHVDVSEASALAHRLLSLGPPDPRDIRRAPELLHGELLPDWYDDWVLLEREHFRQLSLHALEALAEHLVETGRFALALRAALAAVAGEPLRESAHRVLIKVHIAEGNSAEALKQFQMCRRLLREQLDLGPSPQLRQLMSDLTV